MEAEARGFLDDQVLRSRLRSDFSSSYTRRTYIRPRRSLISDVTERRYSTPTLNTSSQITSLPAIPKPQQDIAPLYTTAIKTTFDTVANHLGSSALISAYKSNPRPLAHGKVIGSLKRHLKIKHRNKLQMALLSLAICIVMVGGYVSFLGLRANHAAVVQAAKLTAQANKAATSTTSSKTPTPALSTVKPTTNSLANYVVAPNLPRYIIIPKLGVDTIVESVGVNVSGALETPDNVYDTAWYNESALPGQQGAMLIDGHVSSWTAHGVFYGIKTLVAGDIIKIVRGDGAIFTYTVVKNQVYPSGNVNMTSAMTPVVAGQPGLNLITCTGDVIPGTSQFNERIVVYAKLQ